MSGITDVVELAQALINVESLSGFEYPMIEALESWLIPRGWKVIRQFVKDNNRYNLLSFPEKMKDPKTDIKLLFNSHIDTVPPYFPAKIVGNKLTGRGSCDTKRYL